MSHPVNIKWLEDRNGYPTRLTPARKALREQAPEPLQALQSTRTLMRGTHYRLSAATRRCDLGQSGP